eukprot:m.141499 g.141499  ORF g.141499 m.141499 type:complete len:104 (-) comp22861_c0_seq1:189-500(-)
MCGNRPCTSLAVASPTMPPPTIATSYTPTSSSHTPTVVAATAPAAATPTVPRIRLPAQMCGDGTAALTLAFQLALANRQPNPKVATLLGSTDMLLKCPQPHNV